VQKFVAVDFGGDAGLAVLRGLGAHDLPVAAYVDVTRARDLLGKRDDELDCGADFGFGFGQEVQAAIAYVAGEGFEFARIRIERENSHRQRHVEAARFAAISLFCIGTASAFGWLLAYLRGAIVIADWITAIAGHDPHLIMLLMVLLFTVVGDFIEPVPTIIIFMPLVNILVQAGDIHPVHMGVVLIATLAFGLITPPYGLVLLMAAKFVGVKFSQALRAALPIYMVFFVTIAFIIYFPSVVLWLPRHVMPASVGCFKAPDGPGYICPR